MVAFGNKQESMLVLSNHCESNGTYSLFQKLNIPLQMIAFFGLLYRQWKWGGLGGGPSAHPTFYCEGAEPPPPHFCRIITNFLLFYQGQLIIIRTILESSNKRLVV